MEAALDTQEDCDNDSLSEKSIGFLPIVEDSLRGTFYKIMKQKQKEGMSNSEATVQSMILIGTQVRSAFDSSCYQDESNIKVNQIAVQSMNSCTKHE